MHQVSFHHWGNIDYQEAWDKQETLFNQNVKLKFEARKSELAGETAAPLPTQDHLIFCEHPHVYTLGKSGKPHHLLISQDEMQQKGISYYPINRGGDITYHGPGQLVAYPIFDLEHYFTDIHRFLRYLEEAVILMLAEYRIAAGRIDGLTGVWIDSNEPERARKICAMGIRCSRWITMHGLALNVNTNLDYFKNIIPCGIDDKAVTSMQMELQREINMTEVQHNLKNKLATLFSIQFDK